MDSFQKLLPTHSQIREDEDPENLPRFGATDENIADNIVMLDPEPDELDKSVDRLLGSAPVNIEPSEEEIKVQKGKGDDSPGHDDQPSLPINDDSFSNLQMAAETPKGAVEVGDKPAEEEGQASLKMSMIHPNEDGGDNHSVDNGHNKNNNK